MNNEASLAVGVVGVGYLGSLHARKYAALAGARLVGVFDVDARRASAVAESVGCQAVERLPDLLAQVQAVSVAVPTGLHREIGLAVLGAGVHVLMEKPLAADSASGEALAQAAEAGGLVLQVGHLERFNPVFLELRSMVRRPRFIECHRLSPFVGRGTDTSVVYDVMIHDLDLIDFLVGSDLAAVEAVGVPILSSQIDIANARLKFANGCVANVTASRASLKRERKLRIFEQDAYVSVDFDAGRALVARRGAPRSDSPLDGIEVSEKEIGGGDPLAAEIASFVECVRTGARPQVGAEEGLRALALADRILAAIDVEA